MFLLLYNGPVEKSRGLSQLVAASPTLGLRPLIEPILQLQRTILAIDEKGILPRKSSHESAMTFYREWEPLDEGEILTDGRGLFVVGIEKRARKNKNSDSSKVTLAYVGPDAEPQALEQLVQWINVELSTAVERRHYTSKAFDEIAASPGASPCRPDVKDFEVAKMLADKSLRKIAIAIKSSGGLLVRDVAKQLTEAERGNVDSLVKMMLDNGLIESEVVVVCSRTQAQVVRLRDRDALAASTAAGIKCACGRSLDQERIEEAIRISDLGKEQLNKSRWLTTMVVSELLAAGVRAERILTEVNETTDELDVLADISGELVMFELKDKEFNLGNAYSFGAKRSIIRPRRAVIVTTEHIGNDAREHFQRAKRPARTAAGGVWGADETSEESIVYVEGIENLAGTIRELASDIYAGDAANILERVLPSALMSESVIVAAVRKRSGKQ